MQTDVKIHRMESQDDGMEITLKEILLNEDTSEDDNITDDHIDVPMGCLLECARPDSPTAITDFSVCENDHNCVQLTPHTAINTTCLDNIQTPYHNTYNGSTGTVSGKHPAGRRQV